MKKLLSLILALALLCSVAPAVFAAEDNQNKDFVAFYLTQYEVQAGDTLSSICTTRNIDYAKYLSLIKNVNGISNANSLIAGRSYWIPSNTVGNCTSYYTVYSHLLSSGETVSGLCNTYGIKLSDAEAMIKAVNGTNSLTGFMANTVIYIPVYTTKTGTTPAVTPAPSAAPTTPTTPAAPSSTAAPAPSAAPANQNGDYIAFYLTPYTVQSGDTLSSICNARGINFANYLTVIQNVNKLANYNYLIAGNTYWMPSTTVGNSASYYAVYRHTLVSGDTVFALCQAYGISLSKSSDMIMKLNNVKNLTSFMAGKPILIPVYYENAASGTGTAGTGTTVIGGTPTDTSAASISTGTSSSVTVTNADGSKTTTTTTTTTTVTEDPNLFDAASAASYYLVPYTVVAGDSLISICNALHTSFSKNKDIIAAANGLSTYSLTVGAKIYIPVANPTGYSDSITVKVHTIAAGETVYGICTAAGGNFSASYKLLTALNAGVNFNNLKVGQKLFVPVVRA